MDVLERIRRGYHAIGVGTHRDVLALFDQVGGEPARWSVGDTPDGARSHASREIGADDLFSGLPERYEVIGVEVKFWHYYERCSRLVVGGRFRARPRGSWDVMALPFVHIWCFDGDRLYRVIDCLGGVELRRLAPAEQAAAS